MRSKRFKKLPTDTSKLKANDFENVLKEVKKIVRQNLMSQ